MIHLHLLHPQTPTELTVPRKKLAPPIFSDVGSPGVTSVLLFESMTISRNMDHIFDYSKHFLNPTFPTLLAYNACSLSTKTNFQFWIEDLFENGHEALSEATTPGGDSSEALDV